MTRLAPQCAPSPTRPAYDALAARFRRMHHLEHLLHIASWDQAALMPPLGNEARAAALAELAGLLHGMRTDAGLAAELARAADEPLDELQRANLREMGRAWRHAVALPQALVERREWLSARVEHAWRELRIANDWAGFLPGLREMLALVREEAQRLSQALELAPYDALVDRFEPGLASATIDRVFDDLRGWLPALVAEVGERQRGQAVVAAQGPFPLDAQRRLSEKLVRRLGFDFRAGRLDTSTHPFSGGVPEDVRMTTRYREDDVLVGLLGTIHETGHSRYEQNRPRDWLGQPLSLARSMAIHESQSLAFEMQLGAHPGFAALLSPMLAEAFGAQPAFEPDNLHRLMTRVKPGLIRVDADEVTYPAHVILRYDIERALIDGEAEAEDVPALWDEGMQRLLGLDTRGNHRDGAMQDIHWPSGTFGYFPCYSFGAMYAAQWFAALRREVPDLDTRIAAGDLEVVFGWLDRHIWQAGSRWPTDELARRASGEPLNPAHFRAHLRARYLGA